MVCKSYVILLHVVCRVLVYILKKKDIGLFHFSYQRRQLFFTLLEQ